MTPEIKQRIEQKRRGEIRARYQKGKLGIVPEEWRNTAFSTLFTSTSDYTDNLDKYPLYSLTIEDGITPKTERYERSHFVKMEDSYKLVKPNDYAYNPMNLRFGAGMRTKPWTSDRTEFHPYTFTVLKTKKVKFQTFCV